MAGMNPPFDKSGPALERWTHGYCVTRRYGAPRPLNDGDWLRFVPGKPDQTERFVYLGTDPGTFIAFLGAISTPFTFFDMAGSREAIADGVPDGWIHRDRAYLMTGRAGADGLINSPHRCEIAREGGRIECIARDAQGIEAARGVLGIVGDTGVYDQIVTEPGFRRQGYGTAVMAALGREARKRGVSEQLLIATPEGRALYETMGWSALSEIASVISPGG